MPSVRPARISKGSRVAVSCPASPVDPQRLERGIQRLEELGFEVVRGESCSARLGLWAGNDRARAAELRAFLHDPSIEAIFAGRGGVGCLRLLPYLEGLSDRLRPTWIVGRSDLTAIQLSLWRSHRWVGLSGPMIATDFGGEDRPPAAVVENTLRFLGGSGHADPWCGSAIEVWRAGEAEGDLIPANLSVLTSMVGTPHWPSLRGAILVLEEIGEPPRRCDRMLTQLRLSGGLEGLAGLVLGQFTGCREERPGAASDLLETVLRDHAGTIGVPTLSRFPYGHEPDFQPLPVGCRARIQRDPPSLILLDQKETNRREEQA